MKPLSANGIRLGRVLHNVELDLPEGACLGLIGCNGAGKSTLMGILAGVIRPETGRLEGTEGAAYLPEGFPVDGHMRVSAWERIARGLPGWEPAFAEALAAVIPVPPRLRGAWLSQGQRVRLGLRLTLGRRAPLYLLDDPWLGLDPVAAVHVERAISERSAQATVVIAGQNLEAMERLCSHLALLADGRIQRLAEVEAWRAEAGPGRLDGWLAELGVAS